MTQPAPRTASPDPTVGGVPADAPAPPSATPATGALPQAAAAPDLAAPRYATPWLMVTSVAWERALDGRHTLTVTTHSSLPELAALAEPPLRLDGCPEQPRVTARRVTSGPERGTRLHASMPLGDARTGRWTIRLSAHALGTSRALLVPSAVLPKGLPLRQEAGRFRATVRTDRAGQLVLTVRHAGMRCVLPTRFRRSSKLPRP